MRWTSSRGALALGVAVAVAALPACRGGTGMERLTTGENVDDHEYSPDGSRIAFVSGRTGQNALWRNNFV